MIAIIIFGTRGVTTTPATGKFFCPECGSEQAYAHKRVRRFFTLYFIPLIPLDLVGEYIECGACKSTFKMSVLDLVAPSQHAMPHAVVYDAILSVLAHMVVADGVVTVEEREAISQAFEAIARRPLDSGALDRALDAARGGRAALFPLCRSLTGILNKQGQELVILAAISMAQADGEFANTELQVLSEIASAFEMKVEDVVRLSKAA